MKRHRRKRNDDRDFYEREHSRDGMDDEKLEDRVDYTAVKSVVKLTLFVLKRVLFDFTIIVVTAVFRLIAILFRKALGKNINKVSKNSFIEYFKNILSDYNDK